MKTTTTILEYIASELQMRDKNEFVNKINGVTQLTGFNNDYAFIKKLSKYDSDIEAVVTQSLFGGYELDDKVADKKFKRAFVNKFSAREIKVQTIDLFQNNLVSYTIQNEVLITELFVNLQKYYEGENTSSNAKNDLSGSNSGDATLPQDVVNLDLKSDTMEYADENKVIRAFDKSDGTTKSNAFNADVFDKLNEQMDKLFNRFDRKLFLQIW